jgi:hypothetical protein
LLGRIGSGRADLDALAAEVPCKPGRHLAPARVVNADEEDRRPLLAHGDENIRLTDVFSIDIRE